LTGFECFVTVSIVFCAYLQTTARFSTDGLVLVTGGHDRSVRVWNYDFGSASSSAAGSDDTDADTDSKATAAVAPSLSEVATLTGGHTADIKSVDINHARSLVRHCGGRSIRSILNDHVFTNSPV
jgi:hypothetical protein